MVMAAPSTPRQRPTAPGGADRLLLSLIGLAFVWSSATAHAEGDAHALTLQGYPTIDRVLYVERCASEHPGPRFEMLNKCTCVFERLAHATPYGDYLSMSTAADATRIGGERGSYIRDVAPLQAQIRRWNRLQSEALAACFVTTRP